MATPKFFSYLPNVQYALSANKAGQIDYAEFKDYFRMAMVRDDVFKQDTLYDKYNVKDGARPDRVSYELYGDEQWYWIVLQVNNIVDYYNEWPLSDKELDEFVAKKYGNNGASEIHHYETVETFDSSGNLVLPGGLQVPETFEYTYPTEINGNVYLTSRPDYVTNVGYEREINEKKASIFILKEKYIQDYVREFKNYGRQVKKQKSFISIDDITP